MLKDEFVRRCRQKHGDKYNYDNVPNEFKMTDRVSVICPEHGEFHTIARNHANIGSGCPICGNENRKKLLRMTFQEFVERAITKHGNERYAYNETSFVRASLKTKIFCNKCHQYFEQTPTNHLIGYGCPHCNPIPKKLTHEEFVNKLKSVNPNIEVISEYKGNKKYVTVKCLIDGNVWNSKPNWLLKGQGCKECYNHNRGDKCRKDVTKVLEEANDVHNNKYTYPFIKDEYVNNRSSITIICPIHGEFQQTMIKHITQHQGCNKCQCSHIEEDTARLFINNNIDYTYQKRFGWLGSQTLDFYLPKYNIGIECQGQQHFEPVDFAGKGKEWAEKKYKINVERDNTKYNLCKQNGVLLLYLIPNTYLYEKALEEGRVIYNTDNTTLFDSFKKEIKQILKG